MLLVYSYEFSVMISFNFNLLACCPLDLQLERWPLWIADVKKMGWGGKLKNESQEYLNQFK